MDITNGIDYWYDFDTHSWCHFETIVSDENRYKITIIREPMQAHPSWDIPANCY